MYTGIYLIKTLKMTSMSRVSLEVDGTMTHFSPVISISCCCIGFAMQ